MSMLAELRHIPDRLPRTEPMQLSNRENARLARISLMLGETAQLMLATGRREESEAVQAIADQIDRLRRG